MPWYFRTLASWISELETAGLRVSWIAEPIHPDTGDPLSLLLTARPSPTRATGALMPGQVPNESADAARVRRAAAEEERQAILLIIEGYARQLAHGHGATGAQVLQRIAEDILRRGEG
jgi:hypothetical protein